MTAHDPRVTLTEAEAARITACLPRGAVVRHDLLDTVADLIAARLAPIRALIADFDGWEIDEIDVPWIEVGRLRKALDAPQDAPRGPVGGEQDAEVAGGRSEGERPGEAMCACGALALATPPSERHDRGLHGRDACLDPIAAWRTIR